MALSLSEEELIKEVARFFSYQRVGRAINDRILREIALADSGGVIRLVDGRYRTVK